MSTETAAAITLPSGEKERFLTSGPQVVAGTPPTGMSISFFPVAVSNTGICPPLIRRTAANLVPSGDTATLLQRTTSNVRTLDPVPRSYMAKRYPVMKAYLPSEDMANPKLLLADVSPTVASRRPSAESNTASGLPPFPAISRLPSGVKARAATASCRNRRVPNRRTAPSGSGSPNLSTNPPAGRAGNVADSPRGPAGGGSFGCP